MLHAFVGVLLGVVGAASFAQDAPPTSAEPAPPPAAEQPVDEPRPAGRGADGLPDPSFWIHDFERPISEWLGKPAIDPADLAARPEAYAAALATHGIAFDPERGVVSLRGATLHDLRSLGYPIEYPVVTEIGKQHEALVLVRAWPSVLDACLKALDLLPGRPTQFIEKDPLPSMEEIETGLVSPYWLEPGHGPLFDIQMTWTDDDGRPHEEALEALLFDMNLDRPLDVVGWIYTGSNYGTYRSGSRRVEWFKADVQGDICAVYLEGLDVCLFERNSLDGLSYAPYTLNPDKIPPRQTPVTLRFVPRRDESVAPAPRMDLREFLLRRAAEREAAAAADAEASVPPVGEDGANDADGAANGR